MREVYLPSPMPIADGEGGNNACPTYSWPCQEFKDCIASLPRFRCETGEEIVSVNCEKNCCIIGCYPRPPPLIFSDMN